ncbi:MAG: response regulator [bacterium]|nr:response regulator [bacterium]MDY4100951.1 response regulator [Lachnospiraceae bacterium]
MSEKKKLLLFGDNKSLINDFFGQLSVNFEMLSCSSREEDIYGHLKYYDADALVFCIYDERREDFMILGGIKKLLSERGSSLIVAGDGSKCDEFERLMPAMADLVVRRSRTNTAPVMGMQMETYLNSMSVFRMSKKGTYAMDAAEGALNKSSVTLTDGSRGSFSAAKTGNDSLDDILAAAARAVDEMSAMPAQRTPGERRHVLVVDDDSSMLRMIKDILGDRYDVAAAISGKVALKFLETKRTDLILLDYEMPGQSGAQVYEAILENPVLRHIPVVFLTGVSDRERISAVLALRPRGYLLKPIDSERLKKTVAEIVG